MEIVLYTYIPIFILVSILGIELAKFIVKKHPNNKARVYTFSAIILIILFTTILLYSYPKYVVGLPPHLTIYFSILIISLYVLFINFKKRLIKTTLILLAINIFSLIWFIPFDVKQEGEVSVCKFRFQVYEYNVHDYGTSHILDTIFCYDRSKCKKYGSLVFYDKIGGWKEYFGLKSFK